MEIESPATQQQKRKPSFKREIIITLLIKLAFLIAVKILFFSHPVDKATVAARIDSVFEQTPNVSSPSDLSSRKEHP